MAFTSTHCYRIETMVHGLLGTLVYYSLKLGGGGHQVGGGGGGAPPPPAHPVEPTLTKWNWVFWG